MLAVFLGCSVKTIGVLCDIRRSRQDSGIQQPNNQHHDEHSSTFATVRHANPSPSFPTKRNGGQPTGTNGRTAHLAPPASKGQWHRETLGIYFHISKDILCRSETLIHHAKQHPPCFFFPSAQSAATTTTCWSSFPCHHDHCSLARIFEPDHSSGWMCIAPPGREARSSLLLPAS